MPGPYEMSLHHQDGWRKQYAIPLSDLIDALFAAPNDNFNVDPLDRPDIEVRFHAADDPAHLVLIPFDATMFIVLIESKESLEDEYLPPVETMHND